MDTCISCGKYVPEGRAVCPLCERQVGISHGVMDVSPDILVNKTIDSVFARMFADEDAKLIASCEIPEIYAEE